LNLRILLPLALCLATGVGAQQADLVDPRFLETREELQALLQELQQTAASTAYSSALRRRARDEAEIIERRLREGDFGVNDRIYLAVSVQGQAWFADTVRVEAGPVARLPEVGAVELGGILRSELREHMRAQLSRFLRDPQVDLAESFVRLTILGAVGGQGERYVPAQTTLGQALTQTGLATSSDLEGTTISRNGQILWNMEAGADAIRQGRTLDQMSLQAGDEIQIPARPTGNQWISWIQVGLGIVTAVTLIIWRF